MKTTKKFLAIFLAMTVLFAVCSLSVFAAGNTQYITAGDDYDNNDGITGEGKVQILANGRTIQYGVLSYYDPGDYTGPDPVCTLFAQCAIVYVDGSCDVEYISQEFMLVETRNEYYFDAIFVNVEKDIEMICCEFQIFNASGMLWDATLDIPYTNE